jgi:hypothetical protein
MNPARAFSRLALCALLASAAAAAATAPPGMPRERRQNGIAYLTGGQMQTDIPTFERLALAYPLALEFVRHGAHRDEFLAGARVLVRDAGGKQLLSTVSDGPFLFLRIPPGGYDIVATYDGKTIKNNVVVPRSGHRRVLLEWPAGI